MLQTWIKLIGSVALTLAAVFASGSVLRLYNLANDLAVIAGVVAVMIIMAVWFTIIYKLWKHEAISVLGRLKQMNKGS